MIDDIPAVLTLVVAALAAPATIAGYRLVVRTRPRSWPWGLRAAGLFLAALGLVTLFTSMADAPVAIGVAGVLVLVLVTLD